MLMTDEHEWNISDSVHLLLDEIPSHVTLVAAAKGRSVAEIRAAIDAGVTHIGHNYVQEAALVFSQLNGMAEWHMIGHLQRNKVKTAVEIFDMVETVDSWHIATALDKRCASTDTKMPVLIEVNSGREASKTGLLPEDLHSIVCRFGELEHLALMGLMTMGPRFGDPEQARPFFQETRKAYERLSRLDLPNIEMRWLSMGMSNSYRIAIDEGANLVRIGTKIFGPRTAEDCPR
jgi:pyridoxal phosphate enzyme (YggS family)